MSSQSSNPHPYAIKTTSTGVLSRSNSARSASTAHHFVPSSPTKPKSTLSRPISHRYSSSLNSNELPRPLPVPPSFLSSQPNLLLGIDDDLPDDPRTWSPSDLSTYLSALTSADLPPLVAHDIAAFVRTQNITGKKFLRLTDGDLDDYGLNQHWQNALLRASRVLRQDSIRGRVWNTSFLSGEDDTYSSTSSSSSLNGKSLTDIADARRERRESESSGRVKGMIASFEHSSSPTKSSSSSTSNTSLNMSPTKSKSRPRPQSDILLSRHRHFDPSVPQESRLLPYPPSGYGLYASAAGGPPSLLPQDTSASEDTPFPSGVLPFSPQSTGTMSISSPDYHISVRGLGFPPQPLSFSDPYHTDTHSNGTSRRLPFPPQTAPLQYYPGGENRVFGVPEMRIPRGMMVSDEPEHVVVDNRDSNVLLSPPPHFMSQQQHPEILSPQPRHGTSGRDSPTKVLEEKLEELVEPRPRSRIVSAHSHSRVVSDGRPRSRVASINLNGSGSLRGKKGNGNGSRMGTPVNGGSMRNVAFDVDNEGGDDHGGDGEEGQQSTRTRVVSISSRNHAHRLSGVEVWGESHPHYHHHHHYHHPKKRSGIPFGNSNLNADGDEVFSSVDNHATTGEEEEEEESVSCSEDGEINNIDAVLEKSSSLMGYVKENDSNDIVSTTMGLKKTREPKRSVITVVEREPSFLRDVDLEEESVETLLRKEEEGMGKGGEAWESIGEVDTVKRVVVDADGLVGGGRGCVEDVFLGSEEGGCDVVGEGGKDEGDRDDSKLSSPTSTSPMVKKMKLKKKPMKSDDDVKTLLPLTTTANATTMTEENDDGGGGEIETLGEKVKEMREMVEDVRGRLGNIEKWIDRYEKRIEKKKEEDKVQRVNGSNGGLVMKLVKSFSTLLGYHHSSTTTPRAHHQQQQQQQQQQPPLTLMRCVRKWGLNVSLCVVLFGIGMCMVLLRMLGRRPGGGGGVVGVGVVGVGVGRGFGMGRIVGHGVMLK